MDIAYVDTSAYLKRFLTEARSADMEAFVAANDFELAISSLSVTEFRAVLKRRLLLGAISELFYQKATEQLQQEIASGALQLYSITAATFNLASEIIDGLSSPLGTLDALHLACAKAAGSALMVSGDRQLLRASRESGLQIVDFSAAVA